MVLENPRLQRQKEGRDFIKTLKFGYVFYSDEKPFEFVFLHLPEYGGPDCLKVLDIFCKNSGHVDKSGIFTLGSCGTLTLARIIPNPVEYCLNMSDIERLYKPGYPLREGELEIIRNWDPNFI